MEPMTLGSPTGGPPATNNTYLPPYLMGETNTPRNNSLSPTKARNFTQSPNVPASPEFNRSSMQHKSFLGYHQSPTQSIFSSSATNKSITGPPTQSLFDSLHADKFSLPQTPTRFNNNNISTVQQSGTLNITSPLANQSFNYNNQTLNESYHNNFNNSRINYDYNQGSPIPQKDLKQNIGLYNVANCLSPPKSIDFWITIYGFPVSATALIISHFSQCGNIVDKIFPPQNGNWIHLKFSSRLECDKALNYNEKVLGNNLMIGVTRCKDQSIVEKENLDCNDISISRVRSLTHAGYKSMQSPTEVIPSISAPKKNSGIVTKAMDLFFGW